MTAHILLVEDEPGIREGLASILRLKGYRVVAADSCESGLRSLAEEGFDLVISDWHLGDGLGKRIGESRDCPAIVIIGVAERVEVEAAALTRVLSNLFLNSAEAKNGDVNITVHVDLADRLTLTVADDGPGVPREVAGKIFQPFYSTKDRGHGLGLALACRVLSFLDGKLELLNPGESGARFKVTSPAHVGSCREVCSVT